MASALKAVGDGIKNAFEGVGKAIKGVLTLDLKKVGEGVAQAVGLGGEEGEKAAAAQSSNTMIDNAMQQMMGGKGGGQGGGFPMQALLMAVAPEVAIPMQAMSMLGGMRA